MNKNLTPSKKDLEIELTMNIYALRGHKVMVTERTANNANEFQRELVKKHLKIGQVYLIEGTIVNQNSTIVYLQRFPFIGFNSVNFVDVEPQSAEDDKKHHDYAAYDF